MISIADIINFLETRAPLTLQESYDNAGLICGDRKQVCSGAITSLDLTEQVLEEAIEKKFNLVIVHHPPIFKPLKSLEPKNSVATMLVKAIKHDIAIYAIHTNLDNVLWGVNGEIARRIGLQGTQVLAPLQHTHQKLIVFVPVEHAEKLSNALFESGAGSIGNYSECSFLSEGTGSFKPLKGAHPSIGTEGTRERVKESKIEVLFPVQIQDQLLAAMHENHPYETVAYDILPLANNFHEFGGGLVGELKDAMGTHDFLAHLKQTFQTGTIKFNQTNKTTIKKVALCGGAGKQLINRALALKADVFVTADLTYHDFFIPEEKMLLADIGHFESEQFTSDLLVAMLNEKFPTFAVLKTAHKTNPVNYFL